MKKRALTGILTLALALGLAAPAGAAETARAEVLGVSGVCAAVVDDEGTLWTWGFDRVNQLGTGQPLAGEDEMRFQAQPTQVMEDAALVSAGPYTTLAAKTDGSLWIWGSDFGNLLCGVGDLEDADGYAVQSVPMKLDGLAVKVPHALCGYPTAQK